MAQASNVSQNVEKITITILSVNEKHFVTVDKKLSVKDLKVLLAQKTNAPQDWLFFSFKDEKLTDFSTLDSYGITNDSTIKLWVEPSNKEAFDSNDNATALGCKAPFGIDAWGGLEGMASLGLTSSYLSLQQRMQTQLIQDPECLKQVISNPFVQTFLSNPEYLNQMLISFPEMKKLIDEDTEVASAFNQTDLMKQTSSLLIQNPALLRTLTGGATEENPSGGESNEAAALKEENAKCLSPLHKAKDASKKGLFNSSTMQYLMQQMVSNPDIVRNMYDAPHIQVMLQFLSQHPELAQQFIMTHPMFADNPQLQELMKSAMPFCLEMMQSSTYKEVLSNPEVLQPILQIQQGMDQLQNLSPNCFSALPGITQPADSSFESFMGSMVTAIAKQTSTEPLVKYSSQLEQLNTMGFIHKEECLQALAVTNGDVNEAIELLIKIMESKTA